jgi:hypothetical protein
MLTLRTSLARAVTAALDASPSRIPVLIGGCGTGRTVLLQQLRRGLDRSSVQHIDVERTATTPERFLRAALSRTPFPTSAATSTGARAAFEATLQFFAQSRGPGGEPAVFLLDEFLELRTFESFPGLRRVLHEFISALAASSNRFVLTSRYTARTLRLLRDHSSRFEVIQMPPLGLEDALDLLGPTGATSHDAGDADYLARTVLALADGRPAYVSALIDELHAVREHGGPGGGDAVSALASLLAAEGRIAQQCFFCYELRLHRARGYGALKAILEILAEEEGLTLTEISHRLQRTPGSTKDYLSWLEDVDLVASKQKRYSFTDPLLRVWVRLHCRTTAPSEDDLAREVHRYALPRLPQTSDPGSTPTPAPAPQPEPAFAMAGGPSSGIIEID